MPLSKEAVALSAEFIGVRWFSAFVTATEETGALIRWWRGSGGGKGGEIVRD